MARRKEQEPVQRTEAPAITSEGRLQQLIAMSVDLVEQRLLNGTASSQETTFFLKQMSGREKLELERLREENKLLRAKTEQIQAEKESKAKYSEAIEAFKRYYSQ